MKWNERHIRALFNSFLHTGFRVLTLENSSPSWLSNSLNSVSLSFPLVSCACYFLLLFSGGNLFPLLSSPKGFPSASDYLWLQLVSRQPSGPVWRLRLFFSPQTALREGWRGGWDKTELGGQTVRQKGSAFSWHCNPSPGNSSQREGYPWKCNSWSWPRSLFVMGTRGSRKSFSTVTSKKTKKKL